MSSGFGSGGDRPSVGLRDYNENDGEDVPLNPPSQMNANLISTRTGLNTPGGRAGNEYLSRKTGEDLKLLNENLTRELEEKEREIHRLEEETHKGLLQQKLQRALQDNKDLRKRLDEIRGYESNTQTHQEDNVHLLAEVESLKNELLRSKTDYESLIKSLQDENENLKDDLHKLEVKIGAYDRETNEMEEEIIQAERVKDQLQTELTQVKAQLAQLRSGGRVAELEEKLQNCTQLLQSKEHENETLLKEMDALTHENEQLRALQTEHIQEVQVRFNKEQKRMQVSLEEKQQEIQLLKQEIQAQIDRNKHFENSKEDRDAEILELKNKMKEYEAGYNLTDAIAEIRTIKTQLKKTQLERNTEKDLINRREKELQRYLAENRNLKQMAGVGEDWGLNGEELQLQSVIEIQKLQALHRTDTKIIKKLEEDRLELLDELRKGTVDRTREGLVYLGLTSEKTRMLEEYVERLKNDDPSLPQSDNSLVATQQVAQLQRDLESWKERYARVQVEKDEMSSKLMALMERDKGMAYEQIMKQLTDIKIQYNMASLSQSTPLSSAAAGGMPTILESPMRQSGGGLMSPSRTPHVSQPPPPLPPGSSAELRTIAEKTTTLPLQERHALFARLWAEFQPQVQTQPQQQVMAGSRLMSPRSGGGGVANPSFDGQASTHGNKSFIFPSPADVPSGSLTFDPSAPLSTHHAIMTLNSGDLNHMDSATKSKLLGCLTELLSKERENNELLDSLELYQIRFEKLAARQQMLYIEYNNSRKVWKDEKEELEAKMNQVLEEKETIELKLAKSQPTSSSTASSDPFTSTPASSTDELEDLRRKNLVLQINEKVLARRFHSLEEQFQTQESTLAATKKEFIEMEHTLRLRIVELNRRKKLLETRTQNVQELVKTWVPKEELFKIARKYNWMSQIYAEGITKVDMKLIETNQLLEAQRTMEELKFKNKELTEELTIQVERIEKLKEALSASESSAGVVAGKKTLADKMKDSQGKSTNNRLINQSVPSLLAEVADLTARESSAVKRCIRLDEHLASSNSHTLELETELLDVRKKYHELEIAFQAEQEVVLELRNKTEGSVPYFKANVLQQDLLQMKEKLTEALESVEYYKEIAELANYQAVQLRELKGILSAPTDDDPATTDAEVENDIIKDLRATISALESSSDDAAKIGKVHRENMNLKMAQRTSEKEIQELTKNQLKLIQQCQLLEKELDIKHTDLYRLHNQARASLAEKEKTILDLTSKNSVTGSDTKLNHVMTLQQAETLHQASLKIQQQYEASEKKSLELTEKNSALELKCEELRINLEQYKDLASIMPSATASSTRNKSTPSLSASGKRMKPTAAFENELTDEMNEDLAHPFPSSLSLTGGGPSATTAMDQSELTLRLRQNLIKYSQQLSQLKLAEVKSSHALATLQNKYDFQSQELHTLSEQHAKLQQELIEKDLYITQKENDMKEQYLYLKEQETKLKLSESLKRMDVAKANKRQQRNAVETLKKMQGKSDGSGLDLQGDIEEEDPFIVHDETGAVIGDMAQMDLNELTSLGADLDAATATAGTIGSSNPRMIEQVFVQLQSKLRLAKGVMSDQKDKIHDLEAELERAQQLKAADDNALNSAQEVASLERARLLSTAQATIANLNEQLSSKNQRIEKYQSMLETAQSQYKKRQVVLETEIDRLNQALLEKNSSNLGKLNSAMTFLDEMPRLPKDVVARTEMDNILKEKEHFIGLLNKEIEFLKLKCKDETEARELIDEEMKKLYQSSQLEISGLKQDLAILQAAKQDDAKMNKLINKLRQEMSDKDEAMEKIKLAMSELKESVLAGATDYRKLSAAGGESKDEAGDLSENNDPIYLKRQIGSLEKKLKTQVAAVATEKRLTKEAREASAVFADQMAQKEEQVKALEATIRTKQEELDGLRLKAIQKDEALAKLKETHTRHKVKTKAEVEELRQQHEKEKELLERRAALQAKRDGGAAKDSLSSTKEKPSLGLTQPGAEEKEPTSSASASPSLGPSSAAVAAKSFSDWEAQKKLEKKCASLQLKVNKQMAEIKSYADSLGTLANKLEKEQKGKLELYNKYTGLQAQISAAKQLSGSSMGNLDAGSDADDFTAATVVSDAELEKALTKEGLKQKIYDLESELDQARHKIQVDHPKELLAVKDEVTQTNHKLEALIREKRELEKALKEAGHTHILKAQRSKSSLHSSETSAADAATISSLEAQLSASEQKVLELFMSNLDLKYSAEHSQILISRLRNRLTELSSLIKLINGNYLKKEWQEMIPPEVKEFMDAIQPASDASSSSSAGAPVHQTRALTLILSTFKKIFEKLKSENENLKRNSQSNVDFMAMVKENKTLKKEMKALKEKAGTAPPPSAVAIDKKESEKENKSEHSNRVDPSKPSATSVSTDLSHSIKSEKDVDVNLVSRSELERIYSLHTLTRKELKKASDENMKLKKKLTDSAKQLEALELQLIETEKKLAQSQSGQSAEWFRKEKNYLASIEDLTYERNAAEDEVKKLKTTMKEMKKQMGEMSGLIAHVRTQQQTTQEQVLATAKVQAAVLSATEVESLKERKWQEEMNLLRQEFDRVVQENQSLKQELSAFDAQFFEELEDLKYRYAQSVERVQQLSKELEQLKAPPPQPPPHIHKA